MTSIQDWPKTAVSPWNSTFKVFVIFFITFFQGDEPAGDTEDPKPAADENLPELKTTKWRVENSWGEEKDKPGYLMMTDSWFSEYVYEVVVDKKYVPADIMAVLKQDPVILPAWDPMGSLACIVCGKDEHLAHLWYIR